MKNIFKLLSIILVGVGLYLLSPITLIMDIIEYRRIKKQYIKDHKEV